ncbi:2,3-dihydroxy-2,3-dihydro-p-cumate dehydrogenase [Pueribacillus theae]|uniref:2,3-dihydroxy-2,3-dihydro-p-cumate dehydrogenase n=1 Tax=Pueribacillus theae TaxID=2171751 RepID=A0A2U1K377_9BACI|nr:SDR family oxidoreductase [Pueribacillus theae]PWA11966.1 2,3-dihydroxy-2,3-dihydro-p-cumate dehydrogenase [Pueribacillus theae]
MPKLDSSQPLSGKKAIITGAAQGIGLQIAFQLALDGAEVLIADVLENEAQLACEKIIGETKRSASYFVGDLSIEENCKSMIDKGINMWGKVDILVNNAGSGVIAPFLEQTSETLRKTIDRNLWTTIWACYFVLPHMKEQQYGRIVNIGADSVRNGLWNHAAYNAAKGGVHGLTTGLAREFAENDITVNTVAPCIVATDRVKKLTKTSSEMVQKYLSVIPKGRPAEMEEVALAVSFLASDSSKFITGQVISVNGGSAML